MLNSFFMCKCLGFNYLDLHKETNNLFHYIIYMNKKQSTLYSTLTQ